MGLCEPQFQPPLGKDPTDFWQLGVKVSGLENHSWEGPGSWSGPQVGILSHCGCLSGGGDGRKRRER